MFSTKVPKHFGKKLSLQPLYLVNKKPSRVLKFQTPCQVLLDIFPHTKLISSLDPKAFGCLVCVHIHQQNRNKLDPKSIKCIFLGHSPNQKDYKCYSSITKQVYTSMAVTFLEHQSYYPKSKIQGEHMREYQLWDISGADSVQTKSVHLQNSILEQKVFIFKTPFLTIKHKAGGNIKRLKVRLVARIYSILLDRLSGNFCFSGQSQHYHSSFVPAANQD